MGRRFPCRAFSMSIASPPRPLLTRVVRALILFSVLSSSGARDMAASSASSPPLHTGMFVFVYVAARVWEDVWASVEQVLPFRHLCLLMGFCCCAPEMGPAEMTTLQKHVSFFDRNKDGIIYPWETYEGFRAIGCGPVFSSASALFINGMLSSKTLPAGKSASPLLPVYVVNIHKGKHAGDSGVYDAEGRFVPEKFEEIFQKHAHAHPDSLLSFELMEMLRANKDAKDNSSWVAAYTEWTVLYNLYKDKNGLLHKETIRSMYDGSLFYQMEKDRNSP